MLYYTYILECADGSLYIGCTNNLKKRLQEHNESNLQEEIIEEIGLSFKHPKNLVYRKEIADDGGRIRTLGFFFII